MWVRGARRARNADALTTVAETRCGIRRPNSATFPPPHPEHVLILLPPHPLLASDSTDDPHLGTGKPRDFECFLGVRCPSAVSRGRLAGAAV
jgi:hypothetical protein